MIYYLNELKKTLLFPAHILSETTNALLRNLPPTISPCRDILSASTEIASRSMRTFPRPEFNLKFTPRDDKILGIKERVVMNKPFCKLRHFERFEGEKLFAHKDPRVLIAAPYSGHYATLLRDTVRMMLPFHDVYITDWEDGREVSLHEGNFNFENYVDYLLDFLRFLGPNTHVIAVCQPAVPVLCAASLLAEYNEPCQPSSMTLMGGPVDTRIAPGPVNLFVQEHDLKWFENKLIAAVPKHYPGAGRRVCPGFMMLRGFMSLNTERHKEATKNMYKHLITGDLESAENHRKFYDEYRAVLDLPADYYIDSLRIAFHEHLLPQGRLRWRGYKVQPAAIQKTALMTVEGEMDDISCPGQTFAAHALCKNIPAKMRHHHFQKGVGHYGIFNGRRWRDHIQPQIAKFIQKHHQP